MIKVENFPYTAQDLEMIKKYGTSCPFDLKYMIWRRKMMHLFPYLQALRQKELYQY